MDVKPSKWIKQLFNIQQDELKQCVLCFSIFFFVLCAYYILRPIRDSLAISGGVDNIQWLFSATFIGILLIVPIYGWACTRFRRTQLIIGVYSIVIVTLLAFYSLLCISPDNIWISRAFYVWVSVFNLLMISVFWSLMSDLFTREQAHRLFGLIAAGGSLGALAGPLISALLVVKIGYTHLLLISAIGFSIVVVLLLQLFRTVNISVENQQREQPVTGNPFSGFYLVFKSHYLLNYALFVLLISVLSTFLYFQQAELVSQALPDADSRTQLFAWIDFAVNVLSVISQFLVTGNIVKRLGVAIVLTVIPVILMLGFIALGVYPLLAVVVIISMLRRVGEYAFIRPCREMLFTSLNREMRYKAKNFIDTAIYRGGDAISGWFYTACTGLGFLLSGTALIAAALAGLCAVTGYRLGNKHQRTSIES